MSQGTALTLTAWGWQLIFLMAGYFKLSIIGNIITDPCQEGVTGQIDHPSEPLGYFTTASETIHSQSWKNAGEKKRNTFL